jgi:putative glutathione S-transferase
LIVRKLKGLEELIREYGRCFATLPSHLMAVQAVTVVSPNLGTHGWPFASVDQYPGAEADPLYNSDHIKDLYLKVDPNYGARFVHLVSPTFMDTPLIPPPT